MGSLVVITTSEDLTTGFDSDVDNNQNPADVSFGADPGVGLIPGIPDEMALRCLAFVPYLSRMRLSLVCKAWRSCFRSSAVYNCRHQAGVLEEVLCLSFFEKNSTGSSSNDIGTSSTVPCLSLKLLDHDQWRWLPLATEYRHTKCKVKSFQCRAFQHKVFVFSQADWTILKQANWPHLQALGGPIGPLDIPDVIPCGGSFYSLEGVKIWRFVPGTASWEFIADLPKRHNRSGTNHQKYFLVALGGKLGLVDVWQDRWFWRRKARANMSFLDVRDTEKGLGELKWWPLHQPVDTSGRDVAGFAVFHV